MECPEWTEPRPTAGRRLTRPTPRTRPPVCEGLAINSDAAIDGEPGMGYARHRCVMHAQAEQAALWYYRDTADGLEYLCADGHARLPELDLLAWFVLPDNVTWPDAMWDLSVGSRARRVRAGRFTRSSRHRQSLVSGLGRWDDGAPMSAEAEPATRPQRRDVPRMPCARAATAGRSRRPWGPYSSRYRTPRAEVSTARDGSRLDRVGPSQSRTGSSAP
jgi:hypothetical protein